MVIDNEILDDLTAKAKENPRLRCNLDMRNSTDDQSQRMLNALEPGTVMPIHRHLASSETVIIIRGRIRWLFYDEQGRITESTELWSDGTPDPNSFGIVETVDMYPGGPILNIEKGQWHSLKCLESGTVLFEAKEGAYEPLQDCDVLKM